MNFSLVLTPSAKINIQHTYQNTMFNIIIEVFFKDIFLKDFCNYKSYRHVVRNIQKHYQYVSGGVFVDFSV